MDKKWAETYRKQVRFGTAAIYIIVVAWLFFTGCELFRTGDINGTWWLFTIVVLGLELGFRFWKRNQMKKIQDVLYEECDPFRFKEIYEYFRAKTKKERIKSLYSIQISTALLMQGYEDSAYELMNQIDFSDLPPRFELSYYDFMRMYFSCKNDEQQLAKVKGVFERRLGNDKAMERKLIIQQIKYMDLQVAVHRRDYAIYDKLILECTSDMTRMLQKVSVYMLMARAEFGRGNADKAKEYCQFVLQHGNRTYYVENAKKLLAVLDGQEEEEQSATESVQWEENQLYKEKPDLKFFDGRKKYRRRQRMNYLLWIVFGYAIGFIIYGAMGLKLHQELSNMEVEVWLWGNRALFVLQFGFLGGLLIAGVINGVYLFLKVISKLSLAMKIVIIVFTIPFFLVAGSISVIPYCVYQIVMIVKEREKKK